MKQKIKRKKKNFKMSQQQTVRITTTETTSSSALVINSGYLKTAPGLLKVAQFVNIADFFQSQEKMKKRNESNVLFFHSFFCF